VKAGRCRLAAADLFEPSPRSAAPPARATSAPPSASAASSGVF